MRLCTLDFIVREAAANIRRNMLMSLACLTTVAVSLSFSAYTVLAFRNLDNILHRVAQELVVAVYLRVETTPAERDTVGREIGRLRHVQGQPVLVSKEHAWKEFSATIPDSLKQEVDDNPLPDAFMVRVDAPTHILSVARLLARMPQVERVNAPFLEARRAGAILRFARLATTVITALLIFITTFLVMNTIRLTLYARRYEIRVMQLVGATNGYIRTPFILEGLVLGALGGALACGAVAAGYPYLLELVRHSLAFDLPLLNPGRSLFPFYEQILLLGAIVGAFGSIVSVRRFLRPVELQIPVRRLRRHEVRQLEATRIARVTSSPDGASGSLFHDGSSSPVLDAIQNATPSSEAAPSLPTLAFLPEFDEDDLRETLPTAGARQDAACQDSARQDNGRQEDAPPADPPLNDARRDGRSDPYVVEL